MRYLVFIIALFAALQTNAQNNIVYGAGINYTNGAPTFTPPVRTSRVAIDTVTGKWYHFNTPGGWQLIGNTIEEIAGCTAPAYTPGKGDSKVVINNCSPQPELYFYNGSAWVLVGGGSVYAGEGIRIENDTIILDSLYVLRFRTGDTTDLNAGAVSWNAGEQTLDVVINQGAVTGQMFQEVLYFTKNQTGAQIDDGTVVMAAGTTGNSGKILIAPAIADGSVNSEYILGLATQNLPNGAEGMVTHFGKVRGIQTNGANYGETWVDGDVLYCSAVTPGYLTKVLPTAPNLKIPIAIVIHAHPSNGTLFVRPSHFPDLAQINDVQLSSPTNGQVLTYNSTLSRWENATPANQLQTLSTNGSAGNISISSGNTITLNVNDADASATNELQTLSTGTNTLTLSNGGGTVTVDTNPGDDVTGSGANGQVSFWTGAQTQSGDNGLFWNNTDKRLGVGLTSPQSRFHVVGAGATASTFTAQFHNNTGITNSLMIADNTFVGISTASPQARLHVLGSGTGQATYTAEFHNSTGSNNAFVIRDNGNVGIGTRTPLSTLSIRFPATGDKHLEFNVYNGVVTFESLDRTSGNAPLHFYTGQANSYIAFTSGSTTEKMRLHPNGGLSIGGTVASNNAARLHVVGSGTSSSTWTAQFHNSAGNNNALMIRDDGNVGIGTSAPVSSLHIVSPGTSGSINALRVDNSTPGTVLGVRQNGDISGLSGIFYQASDGRLITDRIRSINTSTGIVFITGGNNGTASTQIGSWTTVTKTSGDYSLLTYNFGGFQPTSGTGTFSFQNFNGVINQTGGANGITRGLHITPTLTSAADWRSIEWNNSSGWGLYGAGTAKSYFAGNVAIGTTTQNASAAFEVASTTQGLLFPRMTTAQRDLIATPADGLVIYNTTDNKLQVRAGGAWVDLH